MFNSLQIDKLLNFFKFISSVLMSVSVVTVDDAFLNDRWLQHPGVIICHKVGGIPTILFLGYYEDGQTFEFPEHGEFKTTEQETGQFFVNQELRILGLIYNDNENHHLKLFTVFLAPSVNHYDDEIRTLHDFTKKLVMKKPVVVTKTVDELNKFLENCGPSAPKIFADQLAAVKVKDTKAKKKRAVVVARITDDQFYYQAYVNFVEKHPLNSKDATQLIRNLDNFPKFAIETLQFGSVQNIYQLAAYFLKAHLCGNRDCGGFSFNKCSKCNTLHYCNRDCQIKDFERHKKDCSWFAQVYKSKKIVPSNLHSILSSLETENETILIEMDVFVREIMLKAYSLFHEALALGIAKSAHARLIYLFIAQLKVDVNIDQINWRKQDQLLGKGKKAEKFSKVVKHLKKAYEVTSAKQRLDYVESFQEMVDLPRNFEEWVERITEGLQFQVAMNQSSGEAKAFFKKVDNEMADEVKRIRNIKL